MPVPTRRRSRRLILAALTLLALVVPRRGGAVVLDDRGEMRLGLRTYTAVRIGTEQMGGEENPLVFPSSAAGHVRQDRYFLEVKLDHDIKRLAETTYGFARLFGWFDPSKLRYNLQYRGEGEGIYDFGPSEFQHQYTKTLNTRLPSPDSKALRALGLVPDVFAQFPPKDYAHFRVDRLRRIARQRNQFYLGYLDVEKGPVFVRIGRQILAWGETDIFRLLDNINPLDDSFGGFLIALDERRKPLDMVRTSYNVGSIGPMHDAFLEGFVARGDTVSTNPGIPEGSPWEPGGLGRVIPQLVTVRNPPSATAVRGGARFVFNISDATVTIAHYYSYFDIPGVRFRFPGNATVPGTTLVSNTPRFGHALQGIQDFPRVPISGGALTFPVPSWYSVVRSEVAYFQDEPMNRQGQGNSADALCGPRPAKPGQLSFCPNTKNPDAALRRLQQENNIEGALNPFVFPRGFDFTRSGPKYGELLQRDTFNIALGLDVNRFVRWINPTQTLFFTTQFFYKHVFDSPGDLVLPVPFSAYPVSPKYPFVGTSGAGVFGTGCRDAKGKKFPCPLQPRLFHLDDDRFLQTLLITTSYSGGRIVPSWATFYDWQGAFVLQPGVSYVRDPFRVTVDYTRIAGPPTGQLGTLRDRDNVRFQFEYVY